VIRSTDASLRLTHFQTTPDSENAKSDVDPSIVKITATIITFNEADNIRAACESVAWADEVIVVDSESTDGTGEIARD